MATLVVHELGHFVAALLVGFKPLAVVFGTGRDIIVLFPNDLPIRLRALPTCGFVLIDMVGSRFMRLRTAIFYIAGAVANVAAILVVLGLPIVTLWLSDAPIFTTAFVVANGVFAFISLFASKPDPATLGVPAGVPVLTDGQGFLATLYGEVPAMQTPGSIGRGSLSPTSTTGSSATWSYQEMNPRSATAECIRPTDAQGHLSLPAGVGRCVSDGQGFISSIVGEKLLQIPYRDPEKIDSYITALISGPHGEPFHDAEELARELVRLTNNAVTSRGTLGAVLTLRNKPEGIRILRQVYEESGDDNDRFFCAAFLAYYFATHHYTDVSARWFLRAQKFGDVPARLPWIARTVKKARPRLSRKVIARRRFSSVSRPVAR